MATTGQNRIVSRLTTGRVLWGALAVALFVGVAAFSVAESFRAPNVPNIILALILVSFAVMAFVLAWESVTQGILRVGPDGYATHLTRLHPWSSVLAIGTAQVEGRPVPTVALRSTEGFAVQQDTLRGFAADETETVLSALDAAAPELPGFEDVVLDAAWWASVEAEAERAVSVVKEASGREPESRDRVAFGFPGLESAIRLDYGMNPEGERVELFVRQGLDLALTSQGRRWLRQNRRRSADAATQVATLFTDHEVTVLPTRGAGFDRLAVSPAGQKTLVFNAEEPDRFRSAHAA